MTEITFVLALGGSLLVALTRPQTWLVYLFCALLLVSAPKSVRLWNQLHYYVGAKYYDEVGLFDFYECVQAAAGSERVRRDLTTYDWRTGPATDCPLTGERLAAFQDDLRRWLGWEELHRAVTDKGLNATVPWLAIGEPLAERFSPDDLALLDPLLLGLAFLVCLRCVGWRRTGLALLFLLSFWGTFDRLWGNYLQYGWLAAAITATALLEKNRKSQLAGALIGVAAALRVFPVILLWGKSRRVWRAAITAGVAMGAGGLSVDGIGGYLEMAQNMQLHSSYIRTEPFNVSVVNMASALIDEATVRLNDGAMRRGIPYQVPDQANWWPLLVPALIGAGWAGLLFAGVTLSRYYYTILVCLTIEKPETTRWLFAINSASLLVLLTDTPMVTQVFSAGLYAAFATLTVQRVFNRPLASAKRAGRKLFKIRIRTR